VAVDAALARAEVSGDFGYLLDRLPELEKQYKTWKGTNFDAAAGLYWQTPVWDAMEFTAGSYQSAGAIVLDDVTVLTRQGERRR
jgi:hypothetical protein